MEQRQTQITEGAGLQESRLNQDFIDWLNKWGPRILTVVLVILLLYVGRNFLRDREIRARDQALFQYGQARESGSPDALLGVARDQRRFLSVWTMATLDAANLHLGVARSGVRLGGNPENQDDLISDEERQEALTTARSLFSDVERRTATRDSLFLARIGARWGLAAVAITERNLDEARALLRDIAESAREMRMEHLASIAQERLDNLDDLQEMQPLFLESQIASRGYVEMERRDPAPLLQQRLSDLDFGLTPQPDPLEGEEAPPSEFGPIFPEPQEEPAPTPPAEEPAETEPPVR